MNNKPTAGYSSKSLAKKLGLREGMNAIAIHAPSEYQDWLGSEKNFLRKKSNPPWDFVHLFVNKLEELEEQLHYLRTNITPDGIVWVSWFKKSAKLPTEITEDIIRDTCLPLGFVDIKVCAVSDVWSGLKLVIRKELR